MLRAAFALLTVLTVLAWRYASVHPRHRAAAALVTINLLTSLVRLGLATLTASAYEAANGAHLSGVPRALFHCDQALFLLWPCGLAAAAAWVFLEEPTRKRVAAWAAATWLAGTTVAVLAYPALRRAALGPYYFAFEVAAVATVLATGWAWWVRREMPSLVEGTIMVLAAVELGAIARWSPFGNGWDWQAEAYLLGYAMLLFLHGGEVWGLRSKSPRSS